MLKVDISPFGIVIATLAVMEVVFVGSRQCVMGPARICSAG